MKKILLILFCAWGSLLADEAGGLIISRNTGEITVDVPKELLENETEFLLSIKVPEMSYLGLSEGKMSIVPTGKIVLLVEQKVGEKFTTSQKIKIYTKNNETKNGGVKVEFVKNRKDVFEELVNETDIKSAYKDYFPHAYETLYSLFVSPDIWNEALGNSQKAESTSDANIYFYQDVAYHSAMMLGKQVGQAITYRDYFRGGDPKAAYDTLMESAKISFEKDDREKSESYLRAAISLFPGSAMALNNLGCIMLKDTNRIVPAGMYIQKANQISPGNAVHEESMAQWFKAAGRNKEAVVWLRKSIEHSGENIPPEEAELLKKWEKDGSNP